MNVVILFWFLGHRCCTVEDGKVRCTVPHFGHLNLASGMFYLVTNDGVQLFPHGPLDFVSHSGQHELGHDFPSSGFDLAGDLLSTWLVHQSGSTSVTT
jgi:hypothetical protein